MTLSADTYRDLTDSARLRFDALKRACLRVQRLKSQGMKGRPAYAAVAAELSADGQPISAERLRKRFESWAARGDTALIDIRLCGGSVHRADRSTLPRAVVLLWHAQRARMADKDPARASWRWLVHRLCAGHALDGVGTWQRLWTQLHPAAEVPAECPWDLHNPPPGWSLSNFRAQPKPTKVAMIAATEGAGRAKAALAKHAGVLTDWTSLRPMEVVFFDDHDLDFGVIVSGQIVRLRLIVAICARTRRTLAYGVRPRLKDDEGIRQSITRRDVQHLVAGMLHTFGVPRDYPTTLTFENAAATLARDLIPVLDRVSGGRVKVDYTSLWESTVKARGWAERGGAPNGKAPLESKFRLLDIELANVRGQMGSNYTRKPGEYDPAAAATLRLMQGSTLVNTEAARTLVKLPFCDLREAHEHLHAALQRMDARTWHAMEGFLEVPEFRYSKGDPVFRPLHPALYAIQLADIQADIAAFASAPEAHQNLWLKYGRTRAESSAECWARLMAGTPFVSISRDSLFELMMDRKTGLTYSGHNALKVEIGGRTIEFRGHEHRLLPGQECQAVFNADRPSHVWLQDHAGRYMGHMEAIARFAYHDDDGRRAALEFQAVQLAHAVREVRSMEMAHPDAMDELMHREGLHLLSSVDKDGRPLPVAQVKDADSAALAAAVSGQEPELTSAQAALEDYA